MQQQRACRKQALGTSQHRPRRCPAAGRTLSGHRIALDGKPLYARHVQATAAQRRRIFVLTWLAYGAYYLCRRPFAICKTTLETKYHLNIVALGHIETGYLIAYALGQFAFGLTADRIGSRRLLGCGMLAVAALSIAFGLSSLATVFAISYAVQGLFQATGWPGVVKAMTSMYREGERGTVMGIWATCYQAGGLVATALATALLAHFGWRLTFIVPAAFIAAL